MKGQRKNLRNNSFFRGMALALILTLIVTMCPSLAGSTNAYAETSKLTTEEPALLVTGSAVIGADAYSESNVGFEKAYTLDELKAMPGAENVLYSSIKSQEPYTKQLSRATGVYVSSILVGTKVDVTKDKVAFVANDGYEVSFDPAASYKNGSGKTTGLAEKRYAFPGLLTGKLDSKTEVQPMLAWALNSDTAKDPQTATKAQKPLTLVAGQLAGDDQNNPLFNKYQEKVIGGKALTETALTVGTKSYTRGDVLLMERAKASYTYANKGGSATDSVCGVPLSVLLDGYNESDVVTFGTADDYGSDASGMTVGELIKKDYMLAYEKDGSAVYDTAKGNSSIYGFFRLYGEGAKPSKLVNSITVTSSSGVDYSTSPYKHITNGGQSGSSPYNIDAITGATLTIEGPGVVNSVPLSVRDLEGKDAGVYRGNYSDVRNDKSTERTYEGVDLYYILNNMSTGDSGIILTDTAKKVQIKNRNRNTIAEFTLEQVNAMHEKGNPILVAYGTSYTDGTEVRPFVFDNAAGADKALGNEDGCLKLVYDKSAITGDLNADYTEFSNMAYIYVAEESEPGFKHDKAPYNTAENSQYVLTVTGKEIGREVNYTVEQLENMVQYDKDGNPVAGGIGYKDEYSLANSSYWYVNEYEGVKLWDLLLKSGLSDKKSTDDKTQVTFCATDGYAAFDKFTLKQIADPNSFGFYEKNAADNNDGKYEGVASDLKDTGYPVLVAYGVNGYPYVIKNTLDGFLSGLSNDGGPLRIISGKTSYNHANGSNQAKLLDKVLVGDDTYHYSTHKYHEKDVYTKLASEKLTVKVLNGSGEDAPTLKDESYEIGDIESLIYGGELTNAELKDAKVKAFYEASKNGSMYSDLYEGVDLNYFLKNVVEIPGEKGTITFNKGLDSEVTMNLSDLLKLTNGYNTTTTLDGLSPVLAYAKNGAPMVASKDEKDGYENKVTLGEGANAETFSIKNNGGPLSIMIPNTSKTAKDAQSITDVKSITINLSPDNYAHIKAPYDTYGTETLTISGEGTRLSKPETIALTELEAKQTLAETGVYSILKNEGGTATQQRFRGINLYKLLKSVGLKNNADKVIITCGDGTTKEFTLSEVRKSTYMNSVTNESNLSMILAYGSAAADNANLEDGKPLVSAKDSAGYDEAYGNDGGPLKLMVGQTDANTPNGGKSGSILKDVVSIEVTASEMTSWNHSSSEVFAQYLNSQFSLQVVDAAGNSLFEKSYTVGEMESMTDLVEREEITSTATNVWEGLNLWGFVEQETKDVPGMNDIITFNVYAEDGFNKDILSIFGMDQIKNGIKDGERRIPIILGYAMDGYPLSSGGKGETPGEGYDSTIGNNGGPIRMMTHGNQGACLQETNKIVIKVNSKGAVTATDKFDTSIAGKDLPFAGVRSVSFDSNDGMWVGTYGGGAAYKAAGGTDYTIYNESSTPALETGFVSAVAADANGGVWMSQNASYTEPTKNKGVVYMDKDGKITSYTVEGNPGTLPDNYVQDIKIDDDGNVWFASFGGLTKYNPTSGKWQTWTKADSGFPAEAVTKIEFDGNGGVWLGFYPEGSTNGVGVPFTGGFAHMDKDGKVTSYPLTATSTAEGVSKLAEVWIRDLAVDKDGGVWVVASGAYANIENVGGSIWHVSKPGAKADAYTGDQLFGKALDGADNAEVRMVAADNNGGLWFGTSADGVFYVQDPAIGADGAMTITKMYSTATGSWTESNMDNVYSLDFHKGTVYVGSSAGLAWLKVESLKENVGDADASTADISFVGNGLVKTGYFTIKGLKNAEGLDKNTFTFDWMNSSGTTGTSTVEGATMKSILKDVLGITDGADKIIFTAKDGYVKEMSLDDMFVKDKDGNRPVLAWKEDGEKCDPKLVIGQKDASDKNKGSWLRDLVKVEVVESAQDTPTKPDGPGTDTPNTPDTPSDSVGDADAATADISFIGSGLEKNGYFTIKGLKNADGIEKSEYEFDWMNKAGSTGTSVVEGASMKNILKDILGITDGADKIRFTTSDGKVATMSLERASDGIEMSLDDMFVKDKDGQRPVLAWNVDGEKCDPTLIIGQKDDTDVNKSKWIKNIVKVEVIDSSKEEADNPTNPDNPDNPNNPDTPDNPNNPDNPGDAGDSNNPGNADKPNVPDGSDEPTSPETPNTPSDNVDSGNADSNTQTGDDMPMGLYGASLLIAALAMAGAFAFRKREE